MRNGDINNKMQTHKITSLLMFSHLYLSITEIKI
nr:MAG TPA: hypothetical protein [Caudoviricetes sp.]